MELINSPEIDYVYLALNVYLRRQPLLTMKNSQIPSASTPSSVETQLNWQITYLAIQLLFNEPLSISS